jgi:hypothetical protein
MTDESRNSDAGDAFRDGVRSVTGVLGAMVEALEQTFNDLREGELSPDRARDAARSTVQRAQETVEQWRDRFDFVSRKEFADLRNEIAELRRAVEALGGQPAAPAEPVITQPDVAAGDGFPVDEG